MSLPPVLDTAAVMDRYGLRDRRAARKVMDAAGAFHVAGRLVVREDDLEEHERALREARKSPANTQRAAYLDAPSRRVPKRPRVAVLKEPLAPGWWRDTSEVG